MKFIAAAVPILFCLFAALFSVAHGASEKEGECLSCHTGKHTESAYPLCSEFKDSPGVGIELPEEMAQKTLTLKDGTIACSTCHVTNWEKFHATDTDKPKSFLKLSADDSKLCLACHYESLGERSHPLHKTAPTREKVECISCYTTHGATDAHLLRANGEEMKLC
ncbi:MAG: hypothetical protein LBD73_03560 [Deferribacteraceae bacterium]|jgi:hypothetical protein|nr:hypothetical protein [Deferribacteraceae bacterium]